ncbi:MAG: hypothetical protein OH340_01275 [Candidatus Parvarchaeota archaeon]|nr:hypothetical protein [Candidatus Rehaiarchaeum fermentans]
MKLSKLNENFSNIFSKNVIFIIFTLVAIFVSAITIIFFYRLPYSSNSTSIYISFKNISYFNYSFIRALINITNKNYLNVSYPTNLSKKIIGSYFISDLPSLIILNTSRENLSAFLITIYLFNNVLNLGFNGSYFSLNDPFISTITGNTSFYSLVLNKTIRTSYVSNPEKIFNNSLISSYVSPFAFIKTNQTKNNTLLVVFSNDPFSAVQLSILDKALSYFGNVTFEDKTSNSINDISSIGPIEYEEPISFKGPFKLIIENDSSSSLSSYAISELITYEENALNPILNQYGFLPFISIGNEFIGFGSFIRPYYFNNLNPLKAKMNSTLSLIFNESVNYISALICKAYNLSNPICNSNYVSKYYSLI